ncbi:MAG: hypothetical protein H6868_05095 [Rhodospirillales bacterium]|nr:hypothetical protein [Rhodospirillales bacterium]
MTIKHSFYVLSAALGLIFLFISAVGFWSMTRLGNLIGEELTMAQAIQNHMEGDMMHDGMLANVYQGMYFVNGSYAERQNVLKETRENAETFRGVVAANKKLPLNPGIVKALSELNEPLERYIASVEGLVGTIARDGTNAAVDLGSVQRQFEVLEGAMEEVSEKMLSYSGGIEKKSKKLIKLSIVLGIIIILSSVVFIVFFVIYGQKSLVRPLQDMSGAMCELASAENAADVSVPAQERHDEIGDIARAMQSCKEKSTEEARKKAIENAKLAEQERKTTMMAIAEKFESTVGTIVSSVANEVSVTQKTAETMGGIVDKTTGLTGEVSQSMSRTAENVNMVASAAEELTASIGEISQQVGRSAKVASDASRQAEETNTKVANLSESAQKIGDVVSLITDIAEQTNLLALNATIEAARAGDAGKGFAVVASEVKNLATQTQAATGEIASQIGEIQNETKEAVEDIRKIAAVIANINEITSAIAAAVEEQEAATQDIVSNIQKASMDVSSTTSQSEQIRAASQETGQATGRVLEASAHLAEQASRLNAEVHSFLSDVRS